MADPQGNARERREGLARNGRVSIRSFDEGLFLTAGATVQTDPTSNSPRYYLPAIGGACPSPGQPGIPIVFSTADDRFEEFSFPMVSVKRDSIEFDSSRLHPGALQYRTAAPGAQRRVYKVGDEVYSEGYEAYEQMRSAKPYNISYTLNIFTRNRGGQLGAGSRSQGNAILEYICGVFLPDGSPFIVKDTVGDYRAYWCFQEGISSEDEFGDPTDRTIHWTVQVRVVGELDFEQPSTSAAVTSISTTYTEESD